MKHDYTALDRAILRAVLHGCTRFDAIHAGTVAAEADALTKNERKHPAHRMVDRRLRALRKVGK